MAQDASAKKAGESTTAAEAELSVQYPVAAAAGESNAVFLVDLDLPGVWLVGDGKRELWIRGSENVRQPLNRPRCIARHPEAGIIVGDSASREIYHIAEPGVEPKPLSGSRIGIPMAIAVDADGKEIFVADAERRALLRLPLSGGNPELLARVNGRGLRFDKRGNLWVLTPDDPAIVKVDISSSQIEPVITGRPFAYPNGLAWHEGSGFVSDGYAQAIWRFTADGELERWFSGEPLLGPVGIDATESSVFVTDPKAVQLFRIDRTSKAAKPEL